jgi:hypothetical protein
MNVVICEDYGYAQTATSITPNDVDKLWPSNVAIKSIDYVYHSLEAIKLVIGFPYVKQTPDSEGIDTYIFHGDVPVLVKNAPPKNKTTLNKRFNIIGNQNIKEGMIVASCCNVTIFKRVKKTNNSAYKYTILTRATSDPEFANYYKFVKCQYDPLQDHMSEYKDRVISNDLQCSIPLSNFIMFDIIKVGFIHNDKTIQLYRLVSEIYNCDKLVRKMTNLYTSSQYSITDLCTEIILQNFNLTWFNGIKYTPRWRKQISTQSEWTSVKYNSLS